MNFDTYKGLSYVFQQENSELRNIQGIDLGGYMIASVDFAISEMLKIQRACIYEPAQGFSEYVT